MRIIEQSEREKTVISERHYPLTVGGWVFPSELPEPEIWARCQECGKWNRINVKLRDFNPTPEKPHETKCACNAKMTATKIQFARKNMKNHREKDDNR